MNFLTSLKHFLSHNIGHRCPVCFDPIEREEQRDQYSKKDLQNLVCHNCITQLAEYTDNSCVKCGDIKNISYQSGYINGYICPECLKSPPPWDTFIFYGLFEKILRDILLDFKFKKNLFYAPILGACLFKKEAIQIGNFDLIAPVPLHIQRLRDRGFNQSFEISKHLAMYLNKKNRLCPSLLERTKNTLPQMTLNYSERKRNIQKAFSALPCKNKAILLVDDIMTTGSTVREASFALKQAGAAHITVATVARTI